jgi:probable addiction module antidote protein
LFGVMARARGMTQIVKDAGLSRESLYRALGENGEPEFSTVLKVAKALGLRLPVLAAE